MGASLRYPGSVTPFGLREAFALAALAAALLLALPFVTPEPGGGEPRTPVTEGASPPSFPSSVPRAPAPTPTPTATPMPRPLDASGLAWAVTFARLREGTPEPVTRATLSPLDLAFPTYPFPDVPDDAWVLAAETTVELLEPTPYALRVEVDGELRVSLDDEEVARRPDRGEGPRVEVVTLMGRGRTALLRLEVWDVGGPVRLRLPPLGPTPR